MTLAILRDIAACYLVVTLVSTSLAKLRTLRPTSVGLVSEAVIPEALAPAAVIAVSAVEVALAAALVAGLQAAGYAVSALFITFGGYRIAVLATTKTIRCGCAGVPRVSAATPAAIAAACTTSLVQAGLGLLCALVPSGSRYFLLGALAAFLAPVVLLARGYIGQLKRSGRVAAPAHAR